jgi:hypothetical protein
MKTQSNISQRWIFIIGCYNSGTTLLENILRQHPSIAGLPTEGQFLTDALVEPRAVGVPRLWAEKENLFRFFPDQENAIGIQVKQDWTALLDKPDAPFAVEKSPTNTARTLWLQKNFHSPYFIHIVRNGYVVALGIHEKVLKSFGPMPNLLHKAANQWTRSLEIVLEDAPKLDHFLEIRYEDLVRDPVAVTTDIFNFLGLPALRTETLIQEYIIHGSSARIENKNPVRLTQLTQQQAKIIEERAGKLLKKYGYNRPPFWFGYARTISRALGKLFHK